MMPLNCPMWDMQSKQFCFQSSFKSTDRILAVLVFTVSWLQTVGAATEKASYKTETKLKCNEPEFKTITR